jgi:hypothetical protein
MTDTAAEIEKPQLEQAIDPAGDTEVVHTAEGEQTQQIDGGDGERPERTENPVFSQRSAIAERFKAQREQRQEQIVALAQANEADPEPAGGEGQQEQQEQTRTEPPKIKVKVRHEERELTQDELIAAAQKTLAGDGYLEEARKLLEDAKQVASSRPHQGGEDPAKTNEQTGETGDQSHQTEDDRALAERLQFGSPDEAAEVIKQLRKSGTTDPQVIARAVYDSQRTTDLAKAKRSYDKFVQDNEALVNDPIAHAGMEAAYYDGLRKDLRNLGYTDDQLPKATEKLVEAHRFHRIQGQDVRDTAALLEESKQAVEKFRGAKSGEQPPAQRKDNSVTVRVDRSERRAGIPQQPARSALPNSSSTQPQPVMNARKAAMQKIAASGRRVIAT